MPGLRSFASDVETAIDLSTQRSGSVGFAWLVTITLATGDVLRRALWPRSIVWGGNTYKADKGGWGPFGESVEPVRQGMELQLQNLVDAEDDAGPRPWSVLHRSLRASGLSLNRARVDLDGVFLVGLVPTVGSVPQHGWYVDGYSIQGEWVRFRLGGLHDGMELDTLVHPLAGERCVFAFRSPECAAPGSGGTCDFSFAACRKWFGDAPIRHSEAAIAAFVGAS